MSDQIEATDRYGGPANWPDPNTVCDGPCEGMGVYPAYSPKHDTKRETTDPQAMSGTDDTAAIEAAGKTPDDDGWAFLTCPDCGGTGKVPERGRLVRWWRRVRGL